MRKTLANTVVVVVVVVVGLAGVVRAQTDPATLPANLDDAVARGLAYLARQQNPDGSFGAGRNPDGTPATAPAAVEAPPMALTALSLTAFLSAGQAPDVGRHGLAVRNAVDYLVGKIPDDGYVGAVKGDKADASGMFGHAVVTLALAEAYGVEEDRDRRTRIRAALVKTLGVTLAAQSAPNRPEPHAGGWGAAPDAPDANLSITAWSVLSLRACRDVGLDVPQAAFDRVAQFVLKCRNPVDRGFAYQPGGAGNAGATGAAILVFQLLGAGDRPEVPEAVKFLSQPSATTRPTNLSPYHTSLAAQLAGESTWSWVAKPVADAALAAQQPDGGWPPAATPAEPGRTFATAKSVLTLTVPYRLLPIYER